MTSVHIIILLATGAGVGFTSGLLGVGGAFIMTPIQFGVFTSMGIPEKMAILLAFGTNLMVILPTAVSGTWRHYRKQAVWWKAALIMGGCSFIAAFGGATLATHLSGASLKIAFGVIVVASGIRMLIARESQSEQKPRDNPWLWIACALPIGFVTGLIGIGGGVLVIPMMVLGLRFRMHTAIATSLAMMILTSFGGIIGYIINGINVPNLPAHSIGYVNLTSGFLLLITSIVMAQVGAMTAHRLPAKQLRYIFIALMFYMGLRMLGVFEWLGWPI